jgi:hypothetical protein
MLTIFNSFRAPGVSDVEIFRDSDDPRQFWLQTQTPAVAVDSTNGNKLFTFSLIARDVDIAFASTPEGAPQQHQLGYLTATVDLAISEAKMALIREHLQAVLGHEQSRPSHYNKLFRLRARRAEPKIGYANTWLRGNVRLDLLNGLGDTFKRESSEDLQPNLRGTCAAALWATFGSEGAQLLWDALHPEESAIDVEPGGAFPLQANIRYELEGIARVPELKVTVDADGTQIYQELRERTRVMERVDGRTFKYPQISELTKSLVDERVIEIKWDDFGIPSGDPDADEIKDELQSALLGVVTNQITASFFSEFEFQGIQETDLGETFTHTLGGKPGSRLWLNEYKEEFISDIHFAFDYRTNMMFRANPQTSLLTTLTPDEITRQVRLLDVGNPEIQVMNVHLETNADFEGDRIANVTAHVDYDEFDASTNRQISKTESFVFRGPEDRYVFRVRMARDGRGRLVDRYTVRAAINYIGTTESPPPIELANITDRALTLSYDRLGYVKVGVAAGDVDWDLISDVFVDFEYSAAAHEPDTRGTVHLTADQRLGSWKSSKHGRNENRYRYTVKYVFKDGREVENSPETDHRENLVVHDNLEGRLHRTFDVVLSAGHVAALNFKVRYQNPPQEPDVQSHIFTSTGSWEYQRSITEGASRDLSYRYLVEYADGHVEGEDWHELPEDVALETIVARRFPLTIFVDGGGLDWSRWRRVVAEITYTDSDHDYQLTRELLLDADSVFDKLEVEAFSPGARAYDFKVTMVPRDIASQEPLIVSGQQAGIMLLETLM